MAFLTKNVIGDISGKFGNAVVRHRYGKEVVYSRPVVTNISYSDKAVAGRVKFANTVKLARLVNSNQDLSAIWRSANIKGTNAYQKIIKHNSAFTTPEGITLNNIISPPGLEIPNSSITLDEDFINIESEIELNNKFISANVFILLAPTNTPGSELLLISSVVSRIVGNKVLCKIQLDQNQFKILSNSSNAILLLSYIFEDNYKKTIGWTSTISILLNNLLRE